MDTITQLKNELHQEYATTKKFLEVFPEGNNNFTPHEKSMKLMPLTTHIVEIFAWPEMILTTEILDFANGDYKPTQLESKEQLLQKLEEDYKKGVTALDKIEEDALNGTWGLANDGHVLAQWSKYGAIRHGLNQVIHHRAQLGVYYRLLNIPLPGSYGPSADSQSF